MMMYLREWLICHKKWKFELQKLLKSTVPWVEVRWYFGGMSMDFYPVTQRYTPEDHTFHGHCCENHKSFKIFYLPKRIKLCFILHIVTWQLKSQSSGICRCSCCKTMAQGTRVGSIGYSHSNRRSVGRGVLCVVHAEII
jgi:hypothetical protein